MMRAGFDSLMPHMNKKTVKINPAFRKFIRECLDMYQDILRVDFYHGTIEYMTEKSSTNAAMSINIRRRYLDFNMRIYPYCEELWKKGEKQELAEMVAHESAHLLTQHMMDMATATYKDEGETTDAWESLTESIGRLACRIDKKTNAKVKD